MKKRILGLLLVICLVACLLPVTAMADTVSASVTVGGKTLKVTAYDSPLYTANTTTEVLDTADNKFNAIGQAISTDAENWNAKFVWNTGDTVPTLYLKGLIIDEYNEDTQKWKARYQDADSRLDDDKKNQATILNGISIPKDQPTKIVITGEDSLIKTKFGIRYYSALELKSEGEAKLTIWNQSAAITSESVSGVPLTVDANLDLFVQTYYNTVNSHVLQTNGADMTINGGNIKVRDGQGNIYGIWAGNGGNITINGGNLDISCTMGTAPTNGSIHATGKIIINGGTVNASASSCVPIYAINGIEINGGTVNILSPYYGINAGKTDNPADVLVNGGTLKIIAEHASYKAIKMGPNIQTAFVGPNEENAEVYDGLGTNHTKPWMLISSEKIEVATKPAETEPSITIPATTPTQTPTQAPTQAATTPTESTAGNDGDSGFNTDIILWAVIGVVAVAAVAVVVIIILKRKKA